MTLATLMLALLASSPTAEAQAKPILLDFTMVGCGPCQKMRPELERLKQDGYPIKVVDRDRSPELCQRYGVTAFPTFIVVDARGRALAQTQGYQPARQLADLYQEARAQLTDASPVVADEAVPAEDAPQTVEEAIAEGNEPRRPKAPRPWETVVRIKVHGPHSVGFGSGTIIASTPDETIILTCAHIFKLEGERQTTPKVFPRKIDIDLFDGVLRGQKVNFAETVSGKAIDYDFARDVGLISIRPGRRLPASPVALEGYRPKEGEGLTTVGCSEGHDATAWSTRVEKSRTGGPSPSYRGTLCLSAPKQGRSGGGLYNSAGQVVGVCDFADYQGDRGFYASPESIHLILARNQLQDLYQTGGNPSQALAARGQRPSRPDTQGLRYRGQDPELAETPTRPKSKAITIPAPNLLGIGDPVVASNDRSSSRSWGTPTTRPASRSQRSQAQDAEFAMDSSVPQPEPLDTTTESSVPPRNVATRGGEWRASRRDDVARTSSLDDEK